MFQNKNSTSVDLLGPDGGRSDMSQRNLTIQQEQPGAGRAVGYRLKM